MTRLDMILGALALALTIAACGLEQGDPAPGGDLDGDRPVAANPLAVLHGFDETDALAPAPVLEAIRRGALRLVALQADTIGDNARNGLADIDPDDGGWDFLLPGSATAHTNSRSPTNIYGATALGVWAALQSGAQDPRLLVAALDAGLGMQAHADVDSGPDFVFGPLLAQRAENPGFAQLARVRYDAKLAAEGGALAFGTLIRDARHAGDDDGLIAYDLGWLILGAASLDAAFPGAGYAADADTFAQLVIDDLASPAPRFELENAHETAYVTGLAWSLVVAAWADEHALEARIRTLLLDRQRGDGSWPVNAPQPGPDLQSTAHALQALALVGLTNQRMRAAVREGGRWLIEHQNNNGGWTDAAGLELPLIDGDIILGLMLARTEIGAGGLIPGAPFLAAPASANARPGRAAPY